MTTLLGIALEYPLTALAVRTLLRDMQAESLLEFEGSIVLSVGWKESMTVGEMTSLTLGYALGGSVWGLMLGALLAEPVVGLALGACIGAAGSMFQKVTLSSGLTSIIRASGRSGAAVLIVLANASNGDALLGLQRAIGAQTLFCMEIGHGDARALRAVLVPF
jgi:uncharacterized membrane protein